MTKKSFENKKSFELRKARTMLDRWGKPEEVSSVIYFLLSKDSSYITGENINVDGGWLSS